MLREIEDAQIHPRFALETTEVLYENLVCAVFMAEGADRVYLAGQERPRELRVQLTVFELESPDREIGVVKMLVVADVDVRY